MSKDDVYEFAGSRYRMMFSNRGAFGDHHWMESFIEPWEEVTFYDDLKGGYNVPMEDFSSDDKTARLWLLKID